MFRSRITSLFAATSLVAGVAGCSTPSTGDDAALVPSRSGTLATTSAATAPTPEENYLAALDATGRFPNVEGDARQLWLRYGQDACQRLDVTRDIVQTRFAMADALADWSPQGQGRGEPGLAEKAVALVDAAHRHLCPDVQAD